VTRRALARACVLAAAALTAFGCGSGGSGEESQRLPSDLADDLAAQSDAVATTLEQEGGCTAQEQAKALRRDVNRAIKADRVPSALQPELRQRANDLVGSISCEPPPQPQPPPPPPPPPPDEEEEDD
jgi:hypothetical protein